MSTADTTTDTFATLDTRETVAAPTRYRVEVRGEWAGGLGGWRPAVSGTLNQTGMSDADASTFEDSDEADEGAETIRAELDADREDDVRVVAI